MAEVTIEKIRQVQAILLKADEDQFEAMLRPHMARMIAIFGEFTGRLDKHERDAFLVTSMQWLWTRRLEIHDGHSIYRLWVAALDATAHSKVKWLASISHYGIRVGSEWVKPAQLRRRG